MIAPKVLYDRRPNTYRGLQKACHVYSSFCMTFVWLFGALVSMRAIDYDLQEIFWDLAVYGKVFKKYFVSVLARGMVDPAPALWLDPGNLALAGTLG